MNDRLAEIKARAADLTYSNYHDYASKRREDLLWLIGKCEALAFLSNGQTLLTQMQEGKIKAMQGVVDAARKVKALRSRLSMMPDESKLFIELHEAFEELDRGQ